MPTIEIGDTVSLFNGVRGTIIDCIEEGHYILMSYNEQAILFRSEDVVDINYIPDDSLIDFNESDTIFN